MSGHPPPVHGPQPDPARRTPGASGPAAPLTAPGRLGLVPPRYWDLWARPRRVIAYVLLVDVAAVILAVGSLRVMPLRHADLLLGPALLLAAVLYIEATGPIERQREKHADVPHVDLNSTWTVAAALLLHPVLVALIVTVIWLHRWIRIRHHYPFRQTFSAAATILALYAAMVVLAAGSRWLDLPAFTDAPRNTASSSVVLAAGVTFVITNMLLIAVAIAMSTPKPTLGDVLPGWEGETLELATVGLAVLVAWSLADWPPAVLLVFWISYALHSRVLFPQLRHAATRDAKTGLLNDRAWRAAATQELDAAAQAGHPCTLLMLDLDDFKQVNDRYGHLTGDMLLRAVSLAVPEQLRPDDLLGRFGGEEFVVLLPGSALGSANDIAERIRKCVSQCAVVIVKPPTEPDDVPTPLLVKVTASVGIAVYPDHGTTLNHLIAAADHAMLAAKDAGKDQVRVYSAGSR